MYEYIKGKIIELSPAFLIIENDGIGYVASISLNTYTSLSGKKEALLYIHQVVKEDSNALYGFVDKEERELFRMLISVSGVGASTGQLMLSSMDVAELKEAIGSGNVLVLKGIKGIGVKTAQRIIIELKDKVFKTGKGTMEVLELSSEKEKEEALAALVMLGFKKAQVEKVLQKELKANPALTVEELIKKSLKQL